jgi:cyclic pyranopterin phosphate synthase
MTNLSDGFGRKHDYLRISLTDKCNLRCVYCMPHNGIDFQPHAALMSEEEILSFAKTFVELGVRKIRLTGGEPLVRKDASRIIQGLGKLPVALTLTSNGLLVDQYLEVLKEAGVNTINISLDSLQEEKFKQITRRNYLSKVKQNIQLLIDNGLQVKLNNVVMKGVNEEEVLEFAKWTLHSPIDIRFIEYMPFGGNKWEFEKVVGYSELKTTLSSAFALEEYPRGKHATSRNFTIKGAKGSLGIISSVTHPFCDDCNRLRLTADGKLKNCLFATSELDLLARLRNGEPYTDLIEQSLAQKHFSRGGLPDFDWKDAKDDYEKNRSMISIGG